MRVVAAALFATFAAGVVAAASPQDEKKPRDNSRMMVLQGCVDGSTLNVHHDDLGRGGVSAPYDHFKLRGNKDLMKVLTKDMRGHLVEVTGIMDDPAQKQGGGKTIPVGSKSMITVNQREVSKLPDPATDPIITVDSFRDLDPHCVGK
jgi:hypothetical protein